MIGAGVTRFERWVVHPLALVFFAVPWEAEMAVRRAARRVRNLVAGPLHPPPPSEPSRPPPGRPFPPAPHPGPFPGPVYPTPPPPRPNAPNVTTVLTPTNASDWWCW